MLRLKRLNHVKRLLLKNVQTFFLKIYFKKINTAGFTHPPVSAHNFFYKEIKELSNESKSYKIFSILFISYKN